MRWVALWEQVESRLQKVSWGKLVVEIEMREGVPIHGRVVREEETFLCPQEKRGKDELL